MTKLYPRILIVHMLGIFEKDQYGLLIRNLFSEWPRDSLAQIFSGGFGEGEAFCGRTFQLSHDERLLGHVFFLIRDSSLGHSAQMVTLSGSKQTSLNPPNRITRWKSSLGSYLLSTGLWELFFPPRLSKRLEQWVKDFAPDVIYAQGYNLTFCRLPLILSARFDIPIVFHTTDDWPNSRYKQFPPMHWLIFREANRLIQRASRRVAFSEQMAIGYEQQFGEPFDVVMNYDDYARFSASEAQRVTDEASVSVVYTGALSAGRWEALADLCNAAANLIAEGLQIKVTAFASGLPTKAINVLQSKANLEIFPPLAHQEVPRILKGADILFLPEKFDRKGAESIRYSISSKAHLYMMSEKPILVYGSPIAGVVDYAKKDQWAFVVDRPDVTLLTDALRQLCTDQALRARLVETGLQVVLRNHDKKKMEPYFANIIQNAANQSDQPRTNS